MRLLQRRKLVFGAAALAAVAGTTGMLAFRGPAEASTVVVYKSPQCGCCGAWADRLRDNGLTVIVNEIDDLGPIRRRLGVPDALEGCHTASVHGYAIEGHVPPREIRRLLAERPAARGLAVPGMPVGSPGMETGAPAERYDVLLFSEDGSTKLFERY